MTNVPQTLSLLQAELKWEASTQGQGTGQEKQPLLSALCCQEHQPLTLQKSHYSGQFPAKALKLTPANKGTNS